MNRQTSVMEKQLEIMRKQDELLARRAELSVHAAGSLEANKCMLMVFAKNTGTAQARDFYWHLLLPIACAIEIRSKEGHRSVEVLDAVQRVRFSGAVTLPLYPTRDTELTTIELQGPVPGQWPLLWQLASEFGRFPADRQHAEIQISIGAAGEAPSAGTSK